MNAQELEKQLSYFTGTEDYHRSSGFTKSIFHTDGVQWLAENTKSFWLIDAIISYQTKPSIAREHFQVWTLHVASTPEYPTDKHIAAILICTDGDKGNGAVELVRQNIEYTDFPLDKIMLYLENGSLDGESVHKILMLPSER